MHSLSLQYVRENIRESRSEGRIKALAFLFLDAVKITLFKN